MTIISGDWLLSLSIIPWRYSQVTAHSHNSFFFFFFFHCWVIGFHGTTYHSLTIHLVKKKKNKNIWAVSAFSYYKTKLRWTIMMIQILCDSKFSFLWNQCPGGQLPGPVESGAAKLLSRGLPYLVPINEWVIRALYILATMWCQHFVLAILVCSDAPLRCYIGTPLVTTDIKHLLMCLSALSISSSAKCLLRTFTCFLIELFFFVRWVGLAAVVLLLSIEF